MWRQEKSHRNQRLSDNNLLSPVWVYLHHTASSCLHQPRKALADRYHPFSSFLLLSSAVLTCYQHFLITICYSSAHSPGARAGSEVLAKIAPICLLLHLAFVGTPLNPKWPKRLQRFSKGKFLYFLLNVDIRKHNTTGFPHATSFLSTMAPSK